MRATQAVGDLVAALGFETRNSGLKREQVAKVLGVAGSTVQRDVRAYRTGGRESLRTSGRESRPTRTLAVHREQIRQSLEQQPARTLAEACHRLAALTSVQRQPTQVSRFWKGLGRKWQRVRALPVPQKKALRNTRPIQRRFSTTH